MLFIDQPVGVGYSYADNGVSVGTTEQAAVDLHAFLTIFFESFIEFKGRPFHLSGESYGTSMFTLYPRPPSDYGGLRGQVVDIYPSSQRK